MGANHQQHRTPREQRENLLRDGRAHRGDHHQTEEQGTHDGSDRVGGVDAAREMPGLLSFFRGGREGERKTRAPEAGGGQNRDGGADEVVGVALEEAVLEVRIQDPEREFGADHVRGQRNRGHQRQLAPSERNVRGSDLPGHEGSDAATDPEPGEKDREDDRETEDRPAERQPQQTRPDDLRAECRQT